MNRSSGSPNPRLFPETRWSVVVAAAQTGVPEARGALGELCRLYWAPLYGFVRNRTADKDEAADLVQGFFMQLMENRAIARADQMRGSFRSFLIGCLRNYLADAYDHRSAQKRGGKTVVVAFDPDLAEQEFLAATQLSPALEHERMFDRQWATSVLRRALNELEREIAPDSMRQFLVLKRFLTPSAADTSYEDIARQLGESVAMIKSAIHRLRGRYREVLRREIGKTVSAPHEIDLEIRHLIDIMSSD